MSSTSTQKVYSFGTSGFRSIEEFTEPVIRHIANAFGDYLIGEIERKGHVLPVLIGGDTREKSRQFIPLIAEILQKKGIDVYMSDADVPSPVLAYAAKYFKALNLGPEETLGAVLMTASHNPWEYGGFNFLTPDAAVMPTSVSKQVEALQEKPLNKTLDRTALGVNTPAQIVQFNPYGLYQEHMKKGIGIDYPAIKKSGLKIYYDPLYATGRRYLPQLLQDEGIDNITMIHGTDQRPADYTGMPEPTGSNLTELSKLVQADQSKLKVGLSNDGDADRFGVLDENGRYLNSNEVLSLVLYHLLKHKKQRGVIVRSQATTHLLDALAKNAGLQVIQSPVGYKHIAEEFIEHEEKGGEQVLIGGESSGGISVLGHIPEKDGLLANLLIAELIATEERPLSQILEEVKDAVSQRYVFRELGVKTTDGQAIKKHFEGLQRQGGELAGFQIDSTRSVQGSDALEQKYGTRDGAKLIFADGSWLLIRASGTEPIVRVYVEGVSEATGNAATKQQQAYHKSQQILDAVQALLQQNFSIREIKEKI